MVESYSKSANHNMRRPVVKENVVQFLRQLLASQPHHLHELEIFAQKENIPIIQPEVAAYFRWLLETIRPKRILEIGTAIGYSALLMADSSKESTIVTIDRNPEMIALAKENFSKFDSRHQISLLEGDALDILPNLEGRFDFVFMDSAKSKYVVFLPELLKYLSVGGLIIMDDVLQGGDVSKPIEEVRRGQRTIYRGLQRLFNQTLKNPALTTSLIPMSDGLLMLRKNEEKVILKD